MVVDVPVLFSWPMAVVERVESQRMMVVRVSLLAAMAYFSELDSRPHSDGSEADLGCPFWKHSSCN
jgi:hypothetical protein